VDLRTDSRMKLSRKAVDIGPEHVGHTIRFVEICDPPPADGAGVVCAVCRTCGNPNDEDSFVLLAVVEDETAVEEIREHLGDLAKCYIEGIQ